MIVHATAERRYPVSDGTVDVGTTTRVQEQFVSTDLEAFVPLVRSIAARIHSRIPSNAGVELGDLLQAGCLGLVHAKRAYQSSKGVPFALFARFRIRGEILDSLRKSDSASRNVRHWERRIRSAEQTLGSELRRDPTETEVSVKLKLDLGTLQRKRHALEISRLSRTFIPLDDSRPENHVCSTNPELLHAESQGRELLARNIGKLPRRWREVIRLYYDQEMTMKQIGDHLRVNISRVSQMHRSALERLNHHLKACGVSSSRQILTS